MTRVIYLFYFTIYGFFYKIVPYLYKKINKKYHSFINHYVTSINYFLNPLFCKVADVVFIKEYNSTKITKSGITDTKRNQKIIVSLTSFPSRINTLWICIESLLRQTVKPDEIILWLADTQFKSLSSLPEKLLNQQKRGLSIRFCDDLKSHKKYYYAFKEYPDDVIITVDDDVVYPQNMVKALMDLYYKYPDSICCNFGSYITFNDKDEINLFRNWQSSFVKMLNEPSYLLAPVGVSGILYPPKSINKEVFNKNVFTNICLYADDLWLKVMGLLNGTKAIQSDCFPRHFFTIQGSQKECLLRINITKKQNDVQFQALLNRYKIRLKKRVS
jgi:hypothetical protein